MIGGWIAIIDAIQSTVSIPTAGIQRRTIFAFSFDAGRLGGEHELVVAVWDPTDASFQPRGKQVRRPQGIWYTPTTGIWQTVWLEPVAAMHIQSLRTTPDFDRGEVRVEVAFAAAAGGYHVRIEALEHELRNTEGGRVSAHLLIPGFVFTDLTRRDRTEKPAAAWTPEETAAFMIERLERGDFYILCPDNDVPRSLDEKRMAWAIGDIIEKMR